MKPHKHVRPKHSPQTPNRHKVTAPRYPLPDTASRYPPPLLQAKNMYSRPVDDVSNHIFLVDEDVHHRHPRDRQTRHLAPNETGQTNRSHRPCSFNQGCPLPVPVRDFSLIHTYASKILSGNLRFVKVQGLTKSLNTNASIHMLGTPPFLRNYHKGMTAIYPLWQDSRERFFECGFSQFAHFLPKKKNKKTGESAATSPGK